MSTSSLPKAAAGVSATVQETELVSTLPGLEPGPGQRGHRQARAAPTNLDKEMSLLVDPHRQDGFGEDHADLTQKVLFQGGGMQLLEARNQGAARSVCPPLPAASVRNTRYSVSLWIQLAICCSRLRSCFHGQSRHNLLGWHLKPNTILFLPVLLIFIL